DCRCSWPVYPLSSMTNIGIFTLLPLVNFFMVAMMSFIVAMMSFMVAMMFIISPMMYSKTLIFYSFVLSNDLKMKMLCLKSVSEERFYCVFACYKKQKRG